MHSIPVREHIQTISKIAPFEWLRFQPVSVSLSLSSLFLICSRRLLRAFSFISRANLYPVLKLLHDLINVKNACAVKNCRQNTSWGVPAYTLPPSGWFSALLITIYPEPPFCHVVAFGSKYTAKCRSHNDKVWNYSVLNFIHRPVL
jgi:hypothetical protein